MKIFKSILAVSIFLGAIVTSICFASPVKAVADVDILSHTGYLDYFDNYHVVGEVQNIGDVHVENVYVTITFYNATNGLLFTTNEDTMLDVILVGRKSPFNYELTDEELSAKVDHYSLDVSFTEYSEGIPIGLEMLWNSSHVETNFMSWVYVDGEIKNIGTQTASFVKIIATFYDGTGNVADAWFTYSDPLSIEQGQKAPFEVLQDITGREETIVSYVLTAESWEYAIVPEFPTWTSMLLTLIVLAVALAIYKQRLLKTSTH